MKLRDVIAALHAPDLREGKSEDEVLDMEVDFNCPVGAMANDLLSVYLDGNTVQVDLG